MYHQFLDPFSKPHTPYTIVMVRHGESEANAAKLFSGWYDADLTPKGVEEARKAGQALKQAGFRFDEAHTSLLTRAQKTLKIILEELEQVTIPVCFTWRLNERHYGDLTGYFKSHMVLQYGEDKVHEWRRNFNVPPPPMRKDHPYYEKIVQKFRDHGGPHNKKIPECESLKQTIGRTIPYWHDVILPRIEDDKKILIVGHETNLRGLIMYLQNLSENEIKELNLPNAVPFVYELDKNFKPLGPPQFLGNVKVITKTATIGDKVEGEASTFRSSFGGLKDKEEK